MIKTPCTWCVDPNATDPDDTLCPTHRAEAEGLSEDSLDRRDQAEHLDYLSTLD